VYGFRSVLSLFAISDPVCVLLSIVLYISVAPVSFCKTEKAGNVDCRRMLLGAFPRFGQGEKNDEVSKVMTILYIYRGLSQYITYNIAPSSN
jgi:hypothetical protein